MKCPAGIDEAGFCLIEGIGVKDNGSHGISLISTAAGMGSDTACCYLGEWCFEGRNGLPKDKAEAKHWLTKAVNGSCSMKKLDNEGKKTPENG